MNHRYDCPKCGESWYSAKGPAEIYCPDKCLFCGGELIYVGSADAGDDETKGGKEVVEEMEAYTAEPEVPCNRKDGKVIELSCPLKGVAYAIGGSEEFPSCSKEYCAWWVAKEDKCAITEAAVSLGAIWSAIYNMFLEKARR